MQTFFCRIARAHLKYPLPRGLPRGFLFLPLDFVEIVTCLGVVGV